MLHATVMAGGSGTRFWPASRRDRPKQLLPLVSDETMLQASVNRLQGLVTPENTLVLTNQRLVDATRQQLPTLPAQAIIGEPCKRDTAPCIALAASLIARRDPTATMLVTPADHVIRNVDEFHTAVKNGMKIIQDDPQRIVTFGVQPNYPAQVFGYIQRDTMIADRTWTVECFREKPDLETARQFVDSGEFYWNAGIFMWRCQTILAALEKYEPAMMGQIREIVAAADGDGFERVFAATFEKIQGKSIDYAVMEHYPDVCVIEAPFDWDDVGNWSAIPRIAGRDQNGNSIAGQHLVIDSMNCIVRGTGDHLLVTLGVQDLVVVQTPDATLVASLQDESAIRKVVQALENRGMDRYL